MTNSHSLRGEMKRALFPGSSCKGAVFCVLMPGWVLQLFHGPFDDKFALAQGRDKSARWCLGPPACLGLETLSCAASQELTP